MKIVILDAQTVTNGDIDLNIFAKYGELVIYNLTSGDDTAKRIKDADIVICNKTILGENELKYAEKLKFITLFATGYNNINIEYCNKKGIIVSNAGSYSTDAVAQHTFAMILELYSMVGKYNQFVKNGGWLNTPSFSPFVYPADELAGKTLGIFGLGTIGKAVCDIALAFKMNVIAYSRHNYDYKNIKYVDFETLLCSSDIISLHAPLNSETKGKFGIDEFSKMKNTAYLINTARGALCDENALCDALNNDVIAGAAIDVLKEEPMRDNCPLLSAKNILITPHVAWAPFTTRKRLINILCENIEGFLYSKPVNKVN